MNLDLNQYFSYLPLAVPNMLVAFVTMLIGLYILIKAGKNQLSRFVALIQISFSIYSTLGTIMSLPISKELYIFTFKIHYIFIFLGLLFTYYASLLLREKVVGKLRAQRVLFNYFIAPAYTLCSFLLVFTNTFFIYDLSAKPDLLQQGITVWQLNSRWDIIYITILECIIAYLFAYNCFMAWYKTLKQRYLKLRFFIIFLASLIASVAMYFAAIGNFLVDMGLIEGNPSRFALYNGMLLISSIVLSFAIVEYNAFVEEGRKVFNEFASITISTIIWTTIYLGLIFLSLKVLDPRDGIALLIASFLVLPILTHTFDKNLRTIIEDIFEKREFQIPEITDEDINYVLKNLMNLRKLEQSVLTSLKVIQTRKKQKNIAPEKALQEIILELIESFKPSEVTKRSRRNLCYEILKMVAINQAVESQVLWDLGFECNSKINSEEKPRFDIKRNSEYTATSVMSYRRLKKEAVNELRWKLVEMEKAS